MCMRRPLLAKELTQPTSASWCYSGGVRGVIEMAANIPWGRGRMCGSRTFLRRGPATRNIDPLGQARTFLALNINDVGIAPAAATHAVLLPFVEVGPVLVFLFPLVLGGGLLEVWNVRKLACRGIGWAVLDGGVSVAEVAEVMNILHSQEDTGGERMNGCIAPLTMIVSNSKEQRD